MHSLKIGPQRPRDASQEKREVDSGKGILIITAYPRQESSYGASGKWVSVGTSCHRGVYLFAYMTVTIFIGSCCTNGADLSRVEEITEIKRWILLRTGRTLDIG